MLTLSKFNYSQTPLRTRVTLAGIVALIALVTAVGAQHFLGWQPCSLCISQRVAYLGLVIAALLAWVPFLPPWLTRGVSLLSAFAGVALAARHTWIQYFPDDMLGCGPGLDHALKKADWLQLGKLLSLLVFLGISGLLLAKRRN
jgi:disulfide bond formation protein DsbB